MPSTSLPPLRLAFAVFLAGSALLLPDARPLFAHGSVNEDIEEATELIEAEPANALGYLRRGELFRIQREWKAALDDYAAAERLDPTLKQLETCRAALELDRGRPRAAQPLLDRLLENDPGHLEGLRLRAEMWTALRRPKDAVADYDRLIELETRPNPDHFLARARAAEATGKGGIEEALLGLDRAVERLGPLVSLESHAIDLELARRNYDGALTRLDRLTPQFGRRETMYERRGEILLMAGRDAEARAAFSSALTAIAALPPGRRAGPGVQEMEARLRTRLSAAEATSSRSSPKPGVEK